MQTSYNGWTASPNAADFGGISPCRVGGADFLPGFRNGPAWEIQRAFWQDFNDTVEALEAPGEHPSDDWGWAFRTNRNANNLSCHASGTAGDGNATQHPNGVPASRTFTAAQIAQIRHLCKVKYRGLLRWGGDFTGTPDAMHVEIIGTEAQVAAFVREVLQGQAPAPAPGNAGTYTVARGDTLSAIAVRFRTSVPALTAANKLTNPNALRVGQVLIIPGHAPTVPAPNPAPQPWLMLPPVRSRPLSFQKWYNAYPFRPALLPIIKPVANNFGPQSETALRKVQARYGLTADGIDGPLTKKVLWDLGWRG